MSRRRKALTNKRSAVRNNLLRIRSDPAGAKLRPIGTYLEPDRDYLYGRNPFFENSIYASNVVASRIYPRHQIPLKRKNCPARLRGTEGDNETGVSSSKKERGANSRERGARRLKRPNDYADASVILIANDKTVGGVGAIRRD